MGYKELVFKLPTDYSEDQLKRKIKSSIQTDDFSFQVLHKSLDARKKSNIHWQVKVLVSSEALKDGISFSEEMLEIPFKKRNEKVIVVGSGPAGFFSAFVLQKAGFDVTIIERGAEVDKRSAGIEEFEKTAEFNPICNYAFGEGGAGTFSDGKLTSRSKRISLEKVFILQSYVDAGAPEEIKFLAYPHLGTDNLKKIVKNLRMQFLELGGQILFENQMVDLEIGSNKFGCLSTNNSGDLEADYLILATGHSAIETYKLLIKKGIKFRTKNFAIGFRVEHPQELINMAQWGKSALPGVKAAEYRLTSKTQAKHSVFTFCMCPGGMVVPATAYKETNIVNGMSYYQRNGKFANAACVAGVHPDELLNKETEPLEILEWLQQLENKFYSYSSKYEAPFCSIKDFLDRKVRQSTKETSYPLGLKDAELWKMLPNNVSESIHQGLMDFNKKLKGFNEGILLGLESKTSSPIQVLREETRQCVGFRNIYMVGEGSGYAGGIISSAADGIKAAMHIING